MGIQLGMCVCVYTGGGHCADANTAVSEGLVSGHRYRWCWRYYSTHPSSWMVESPGCAAAVIATILRLL